MLFSIEKSIIDINAEIEKLNFGHYPKNLYNPIYYIMGLGGKRIRPLLVLLANHLFSENNDAPLKPAIAVEVFHNFTLMHDDIMDNAPLRRGKPTVHEKWNSNIAILSGDVMLVKSYELLMTVEERILKKVYASFHQCAADVCEGQQLDVDYETLSNVTAEEYLYMISRKTASLLGFCLELGALIGGGSDKDAALLKQVGVDIGIAFQLKDDLLDVFGDKEKFGKKVGGDILAKKKTYLLIEAFRRAKGQDLEILKAVFLEDQFSDEEKIEKTTAVYKRLNIDFAVSDEIEKYYKKGINNLLKVNADLYKKNRIKIFVEKLMQRES